MTPSSFTAVIELWPTIEAAVSDIGATRSMVSKWKRRDSIPAEWWSTILNTAVAREAGLSAGDMAALAARELSEARA